MSEVVIKIENLGKAYQIGAKKTEGYTALRDVLVEGVKKVARRVRTGQIFNPQAEQSEIFWALKDVNLEIKKGEIVGIIGRNGAGKSTLLKILSRITEPTTGSIKIKGRIASLLEVGTGFHPELTGRENIYLSGAVLGMKRQEIKQKFDEIVAFAGIEQFLETPVKRYSSGMYVRLGFAIAAHLEPEILLVDEVLAVGDAEFQKKCLGKMDDVAKEGRTVLFVSHNMGAVERLCHKSILLEKGKKIFQGHTKATKEKYLKLLKLNSNQQSFVKTNGKIVESIQLASNGIISNMIVIHSTFSIELSIHSQIVLNSPVIGIVIKDNYKNALIGINNHHYGITFSNQQLNKGKITIEIENVPLAKGEYAMDIFIGDYQRDLEVLEEVISFSMIEDKNTISATKVTPHLNSIHLKDVKWKIKSSQMFI